MSSATNIPAKINIRTDLVFLARKPCLSVRNGKSLDHLVDISEQKLVEIISRITYSVVGEPINTLQKIIIII